MRENHALVRTPLRWAGSKRQLLAGLRGYWSKHFGQYIEPFAGSACLFFDIEPRLAILGDLNRELISAYRVMRDDPVDLFKSVKGLPSSEGAYYAIRCQHIEALTPMQAAARFYYLNRHCFNGLYRTNSQGLFNVPYGTRLSPAAPQLEDFINASNLLRRATLIGGDFEKTLVHAGKGDFVYLDPPYVVNSRRVFTQYLPDSFNEADLDRLGEALDRLHARGASFVLTYADSSEANKLLRKWHRRRWRTRRNIAGFAHNRRFAYEIIATNIGS